MREIKFRAWDKASNKFRGINGARDLFDIRCDGVVHDDYVLQQFTGLKDNNGVDIYEGDILRHYDHRGCKEGCYFQGVVCFEGGAWESVGCYSEWPECQVIGNIYHNPELLKDIK